MSDEIKKDELVNAGEEKQLDDKALEQVVGGDSPKYVDKASNVLAQGCAAGVHYTSATLY
jgi:bacteriocin-like protein